MGTQADTSGTTVRVDNQINVAQLLKQPVGATRRYELAVEAVTLGEERVARQIEGAIKLTRVGRGVLVTGQATATVELTCVRCLDEYVQPLSLELEEEFRPAIDVTSGASIPYAEDAPGAEFFLIGEDHVLDLTEALRQAVWLATPMMPLCRDDCPGIPVAQFDETDDDREPTTAATSDARLAVLGRLLDDTADGAAARPRAPSPRD